MLGEVVVAVGTAAVHQRHMHAGFRRRLAAQPPEAPDPTTITSNFAVADFWATGCSPLRTC